MIFRRTLVRELTATAIGLFVVLTAILFTNLVLRLLARAAGGAVAPDGILALLGFNALFYLNVLLAVALFLTVLLTLSRWYRDSEMIVWMTSGQSLTALLKPILWFSAPFLVAIVALSLFLSPWAERRKIEFERQLESRDEISFITPGLFREFKRAHLVVFIDSINTFDGTIRNVFLHSIDDEKDATTLARIARLEEGPDGARYVVLEDGRRYEGSPGSADFRIIEFEKLGRVIEPAAARALPASRKAIPTEILAITDGDAERAELFWRLSVPILAFVLTLLAIPLSHVNPRLGRSFNLVSAAFLYLLYTNCLNIVQSLIAQGKLDFWVGLVAPHATALVVVFILFRHQLSVFGLFRRPPRGGPAEPAAGSAA
ncbi:MAG TPA: LPS export ABC transporter permease LptF [Casimicrobiaceae bacterium]|jgi:lipopolysaccharide export system permease protein|nr:LPS export ABC transporter permease LptF [Casimicrobiaceae bacterium]